MENNKKFQKNKKSKGGFQRKFTKDKDVPNEKNDRSPHNDVSWYVRTPQLVKDVGSFSFNAGLGTPIKLYSNSGYGEFIGTIPGIFNIYAGPSVGVSGGATVATAPINTAAANIYSYVRHANSGHSNYDQQDLMMYLLAMDSLYSFHAWMCRLYGYCTIYSLKNKYIGTAMLRANSVNDNNLLSSLADFRSYINRFANSIASLAVPNTMPYFLRHMWMYSNIYKDENVEKAQLYQYVPAYLYKYKRDDQGAGMLEATPLCARVANGKLTVNSTAYTVQTIKAYGDDLLNAVLSDEDVGIMSGDILKAFGDGSLLRPNLIGELYQVVPAWSEEVLTQIHNTQFAGVYPLKLSYEGEAEVSLNTMDVTQTTGIDAGYVISKPVFQKARNLTFDSIIDTWKDTVPPEDVIVMTRNLLTAYTMPGVDNTYLTSCGSDVCFFGAVWKYGADGALSRVITHEFDDGVADDCLVFNEYPVYRQMDSTNYQLQKIKGELSTYAVISEDNISAIHNIALQSMFGTPYFK